jgi:hypothetical protein
MADPGQLLKQSRELKDRLKRPAGKVSKLGKEIADAKATVKLRAMNELKTRK